LGRCAALPKLKLGLGAHWPEVAGLEMLRELEWFELGGNLLVLPPGLVWPGARRGKLACAPLVARSVRHNTGPFHRACSERLQKPGIEHTVTAAPGVDHHPTALLAMPPSRRSEGKRTTVSPAAGRGHGVAQQLDGILALAAVILAEIVEHPGLAVAAAGVTVLEFGQLI
jgi:hypothetical protein